MKKANPASHDSGVYCTDIQENLRFWDRMHILTYARGRCPFSLYFPVVPRIGEISNFDLVSDVAKVVDLLA